MARGCAVGAALAAAGFFVAQGFPRRRYADHTSARRARARGRGDSRDSRPGIETAARRPPLLDISERQPDAVAPIAAAFMFVPAIMVTIPVFPAPIVRMHRNAEGWLIIIMFMGVPAVGGIVGVANNLGRCRC